MSKLAIDDSLWRAAYRCSCPALTLGFLLSSPLWYMHFNGKYQMQVWNHPVTDGLHFHWWSCCIDSGLCHDLMLPWGQTWQGVKLEPSVTILNWHLVSPVFYSNSMSLCCEGADLQGLPKNCHTNPHSVSFWSKPHANAFVFMAVSATEHLVIVLIILHKVYSFWLVSLLEG